MVLHHCDVVFLCDFLFHFQRLQEIGKDPKTGMPNLNLSVGRGTLITQSTTLCQILRPMELKAQGYIKVPVARFDTSNRQVACGSYERVVVIIHRQVFRIYSEHPRQDQQNNKNQQVSNKPGILCGASCCS